MVSVNSVNAGVSAEIFHFILLYHFVCLCFQGIDDFINEESRFFVDFMALSTYINVTSDMIHVAKYIKIAKTNSCI